MGFAEHIHAIANRLPQCRETLLFSVTLPKVLVDFTKAGPAERNLLRFDVERKLPKELTLSFITCRAEKIFLYICVIKKFH